MTVKPLKTERLILRDIETTDLESIFEFNADPEVARFLPWGPNSVEQTQAFIREVLQAQQATPRTFFPFAMVKQNTHKLIGICHLKIQNIVHAEAEIGYTLNRTYWGNGYTTEAANAVLEFGFSGLNLHRIYARFAKGNHASENIMKKLGMQKEGCLRDNLKIHGQWVDHPCYSILEPEWKKPRSSESLISPKPSEFWDKLDHLVATSTLHIDRPKNSRHPRYPELIYPLDYGYLQGTRSADGDDIDVWIGTCPDKNIAGVICTVDLDKRDSEIKILLGCTETEIQTILGFHSGSAQAGLFIGRET